MCHFAVPKLCKLKDPFNLITSESIPGLHCSSHECGPRTNIGVSIPSTSSVPFLSRGSLTTVCFESVTLQLIKPQL